METTGPQERGSPWARALRRLQGRVIQPLQIRETGAEGDIPNNFGGEIPTLEPSSAPTASPQRRQAALGGGHPPAGTVRACWPLTSRTLGKQGQVSESPPPSPASWPAHGSSMERGQGKLGWGGQLPHCCHHCPQGHSRHWSHPWEAGARRAWCRPSQASGAHGLGIGSPFPVCRAAGEQGPTSTQSWQHPEPWVLGPF